MDDYLVAVTVYIDQNVRGVCQVIENGLDVV